MPDLDLLPSAMDGELAARMANRIRQMPNGCIEWVGSKTPHGYGKIGYRGKRFYTHRLTYIAENGEVPESKVIDHICRNRSCLRVDHLQAVSQKLNMENLSEVSSSSSGHRGVSWCSQTRKWKVRLVHNGKEHWGGRHTRLPDAVAAAEELRRKYFTNSDHRLKHASV